MEWESALAVALTASPAAALREQRAAVSAAPLAAERDDASARPQAVSEPAVGPAEAAELALAQNAFAGPESAVAEARAVVSEVQALGQPDAVELLMA